MSNQEQWKSHSIKGLFICIIGILLMGAVILLICQDTYVINNDHEYDHSKVNELNNTIYKTINHHTEIIISLGELHSVLLDSNDLIMRMSHYTNKHDPSKKVILCPECSKDDVSIIDTEPIEEQLENTDNIDNTEQLAVDIKEIKISIGAVQSNLLSQKTALEFELNKLRKQTDESK